MQYLMRQYEEIEKLKREIKSKLTKYVSETELEKMRSKYISLIRKLNSYTLGDLYKNRTRYRRNG